MSTDKLQSTQILEDALIDAERLLAHASEYGIQIEDQYIKSLVGAKRNQQTDKWTEQEEINFWKAFQVLSKKVYPVTIDSLRAASKPIKPKKTWWIKIWGTKNKSLVQHSVSFYRRIAIFSMLGMLVVQIYSLIGTAQMAKVTNGDNRMQEIEQRLLSLNLITSANHEDRSAMNEKTNLEIEMEELAQEVESGIHLLKDWLHITPNIWSREAHKHSEAIVNEEIDAMGPPVGAGAYQISENIVIKQQAKSLIIILNQYILPLLYGLLGGIAFVLRSLAIETREMTYTATSRIKYGLRIHLGALAGLIIGFLWGDIQDKTFGVAESLSPLAVAFLAGYSVDFLFRMLDSVIGTAEKRNGGDSSEKSSKE